MQRIKQISVATTITLVFACAYIQAQPPDGAALDSKVSQQTTVQPVDNPGFIEVSEKLRTIVRATQTMPPQATVPLLEEFRKNAFAPAHEKQIAAFLLANASEEQGQPADARLTASLYMEASQYKPLRVIARMRAAQLALSAQDEAGAQSVLEDLLNLAREEHERKRARRAKKHPQERGVAALDEKHLEQNLPKAVYALLESKFRTGDLNASENLAKSIKLWYPDSEFAIGADYFLGKVKLDRDNDPTTALVHYRRYLTKSPGGKRAVEISRTLAALASASPTAGAAPDPAMTPASVALSVADQNLIAYAYFKHSLWKEALQQWNSSNPSQILRAVCLMKTGQKQEAVAFLLRSIKTNPRDPLIANVTTTMCGPLTKDESVALFKQVLAAHPDPDEEVLWNIGKRLTNEQGAPFFLQLLAKYPHSVHAPESAWRLFWSQAGKGFESRDKQRKDQFSKALTTAMNALKLHPTSDFSPHLSFWRGKMQEQLGLSADAMASYMVTSQQFPATYYSYRAEQRYLHLQSKQSGKLVPDRQWNTIPGRRSPAPNWTWPEPPELFTWQSMPAKMGSTAALLAWLGFYDECLKNLPGLVSPEMKSWLYLKQGNLVSSIGTAGYKIVGTPRQSKRWELAYPLGYAQEVEHESKRWNLDPLLVHGLIRQESRYDRNARSRSNAMGLMQLLKGTAYGVSKHNNIPLRDANEIYNPNTNVALGCAYLAYVLRRGDGNMVYAVASYNGGPNAVARWRKKHQELGITDVDAFVENIPFPETQNYVRQVFSHYWNYERLYGN